MPSPPAAAPLLSAEKITLSALELLDREGLAALSIRRLAAELKVSPKSLYHYFPTKEDLLQEAYTTILKELDVPKLGSETWQEGFKRLAKSLRQTMRRHSGFVSYYLHGRRVSTAELDIYEALYQLLRRAGVPHHIVTQYGSVLVLFLVGFCLAELNGNFAPEVFHRRKAFAQAQPERFPMALSLRMPDSAQDSEDFFQIALDIMLAGITAQAQRAR